MREGGRVGRPQMASVYVLTETAFRGVRLSAMAERWTTEMFVGYGARK